MRAVQDSVSALCRDGEEAEGPCSTAAIGSAWVAFHEDIADNKMKRVYNFSNAVRGKFYRKCAELRLPIYLDSAMRRWLERIAKKKGKPVGELVNQLLKKDLAVLETRRRLQGRGAA